MSASNGIIDSLNFFGSNVVISSAMQALGVCGVILGSSSALKRWIAISACTPPLPPDTPPPTITEAPLKGWRRVFNKKTVPLIAGPLFGFTTQLLVVWIIPRYTSTTFQNVFWSIFNFGFFTIAFEGLFRSALPVPTMVMFTRNDTPQKFQTKQSYISKYPHRPFISALCSLILIGVTSQGMRFLLPIGAGAVVAALVSGSSFPRITMRHALIGLNGYVLGIPLVSLLIVGIVALIELVSGSTDSEPKPKEPDMRSYPSAWVEELMLTFVSAIPTLFPGLLISLALRFDHSKSCSPVVPAGPGEPVQVPLSIPGFSRPIFNAAIIALGATLATFKGLALLYPFFSVAGFDAVYVFVTVPVVSLAMFVRAKSLGQVSELWAYEERWLPKVDKEEEAKPVTDDVEANAASDDDKAPLLSKE